MAADGDFLSPSQAARVLGLSASRVVQLNREGRLAAVMSPLGRLYRASEVQALADRRAAGQEAKTYSKEMQLARSDRKYRRKVASPKRWQAILDAKQGPCRVCETAPPNEMAHLISRARGGDDVEANIVPLCREHHGLFDQMDRDVCLKNCDTLTDAEYAYLIARQGEQVFEQRFGVKYQDAR